jgi:putative ABC transport system substrate-binding protein
MGDRNMRCSTAGLIATIAFAVLSAPPRAPAQQPGKVPRIGFLSAEAGAATADLTEAFQQGLHDLGYAEGQNIVIVYRFAQGKYERLPDLAAELVRLKVDVIVAVATPAAQAAKSAAGPIPIVFTIVGDPVASGLVRSLAQPGGNVPGLSVVATDLSGKRLELLKEMVPGVSRVAVLWDPGQPVGALLLKETEAAARALGRQLQPVEARGHDDFQRALSTIKKMRAGGLVVLPSQPFAAHRHRLADLLIKERLPAVFVRRDYVEAGGLMSYSAKFGDSYRRAAYYGGKILKGAKPADLPVEQPMRFELVINMKTAKALGLTIPQSVLIRADHMIQ